MKPLAFALLVIALHLGIAALSASRHSRLASSSFALITSDPQR
jgi:hypothetical protein